MTKRPPKEESTFMDDNESIESDNDSEEGRGGFIKVEGVKGRFLMVKSINDKYGIRPKGVESITLSQFATSYSKCRTKPKDITFNEEGCTDECGIIIDHLTEKSLPKYIKLNNIDEFYRLRQFSTVLKIHTSSKKSGEEEYFAEMQLFSPWRPADLESWENTETCVKEFNRRRYDIMTVRKKTFPFSMNKLIEEIKAQEGLNHIADEIAEMLDGQGAQEDAEAVEEGSEDTLRPVTNFSDWQDDLNNHFDHNKKCNESKFRPLEIQPYEQLLTATKTLVPEQKLVLQKVLDFVKTTVQCRNSGLARDAPKLIGLIVHGGGGKDFSSNLQ